MARAHSESGFTLIELLVVIAAGIVVLTAIFALLDTTLHFTTRTFTLVDASQRARIVTEQLENELHSACVGVNVTPIQAASSGTSLSFISQYGSTASNADAAAPTPVRHTITYDPTGHTLTDTTTAASGGSAPNWTFGGTTTTKPLLANVTTQGSSPAFQYFAYASPGSQYTDLAGNTYEMIMDGINAIPGTTTVPAAAPLTVPLSTTDAQNTSEVLIKLLVGGAGGSGESVNVRGTGTYNQNASNASITDQVLLRLTPPVNHDGDGATFSPCQ
jgi:prepilin-type N-terminal cleavage/methylation domain-containing protein